MNFILTKKLYNDIVIKTKNCKKIDINISIPDMYRSQFGTHYACFLGNNVWCKKRPLSNRMEFF